MSGRPRYDFSETSCSLEIQKENTERHKRFSLSWACGHGQHALDEHDTGPLKGWIVRYHIPWGEENEACV